MNPPASLIHPASRRQRFWRVRLLAIILGTGIAVVLAEGTLRLFGLDFAAPYQSNAAGIVTLNPRARFWNLTEGRVLVTTNSAGFHDHEHSVKKPPGTLRIAVLGDSFTEALQVPITSAFWSVIERELADCPSRHGRSVEVLSFGISGYGTTQELQMLRQVVWSYEPDIVLLAFLPGNDVRNNSRELEPDQARPFYDLVDGRLELDDSFRDDADRRRRQESWTFRTKDGLIRHVRVISAVYRAKERIKEWWQSPSAASVAESGLDAAVFGPPIDERWERAWMITEGVIGLMHDEVRARGAKFFVVELNNAVQVHPDPDFIAATAKRLNANDLDEPDRRLQRLSDERGFPFLSLTKPMRTIAQRDRIYFHGFQNTSPGSGHWNEPGHEVAGKFIAAALCDSGLMEAK